MSYTLQSNHLLKVFLFINMLFFKFIFKQSLTSYSRRATAVYDVMFTEKRFLHFYCHYIVTFKKNTLEQSKVYYTQ